jgi:signal transduction histidine kinase
METLSPPISLLAIDAEPTELAARDHAIKNCVCIIMGFAKSVEPYVEPVALPRLEQLLDASRRLQELLTRQDGVHANSRATWQPVPVELVFRSVTDRLATAIEEAGVSLAVACDGGFVLGHFGELAEAMYNLACNAIQASSRGSRVQLTTRVTEEGDHEWAVRDDGCGMAVKLVRQLGRTRIPSRTGGMGMGLSIALRIVRNHDGLLRVQSTEGSGTTMTVWLPGERLRAEGAPR